MIHKTMPMPTGQEAYRAG